MKILMVSKALPTSYPGGTQTHTVNLSHALGARGHEVTILTASGSLTNRRAYRIGEHITIQPVFYVPGRLGVLRLHTIDDATFALSVLRFLKRHAGEFDIVHLQGRSGALFAGDRTRRKTPCVVTFHGHLRSEHAAAISTGTIGPKLRCEMACAAGYASAHERRMARHADGVIAVSGSMLETVTSDIAPLHQPHAVIPNGVNAGDFMPAPHRTVPLRIVSVSRLDPLKGHTYLLAAAAKLMPLVPGLTLHIVGEGPQRPLLERMMSDLHLEGVVTLTGALRGQALLDELQQAQLFVLPSLRETQGIAFMEALLCGVPVVGFDIPGVDEVLANGKTATLVPLRDEAALTRAIGDALLDADSYAAMAARGRTHILERFQWPAIAQRTEQFYHTVIEKHYA
jgi:glycosyltransferase involved in cell wall biosynthesis